MPLWPQKIASYSIFERDEDLIGIADVTMPNIVNLTDTMKFGAGESDVPIVGFWGPASIVINWHAPYEHTARLAIQDGMVLDAWVAHQLHDSGNNKVVHKGWRYWFWTLPKGLNLGTLDIGVASGASSEFEIFAIKGLYDDVEQFHLDKENYIYKVQGQDYLARVKQLIGRT
jgi:phage tail tube protein FII